MSSMSQGANKLNKSRRTWTPREEEVLLAALKELVVNGWKSDNGFRAGYLTKLEEAMRKEFPSTDLKGMPHINSKTTTWKKAYNSLIDILKNTGIGFNVDGKHMIDCTDEQWLGIVQKDSNASNMRFKSWPYLDAWREIFGKDRANGDEAEDIMEAAHDMYRNIDLNGDLGDGAYHVPFDDMFHNIEKEESTSQTQQPEVVSRVNKKKRKTNDGFEIMCNALVELSREMGGKLDTIASRIGHDVDVAAARKAVYAELSAIPGLSQKVVFEVCDLLAKETERLDIFTSLPHEAKPEYVRHLLEEKYKV